MNNVNRRTELAEAFDRIPSAAGSASNKNATYDD